MSANRQAVRAGKALVTSVCIGACGVHAQTTYFVDAVCGDDSWTGTQSVCTPGDGPKRTIQAALDVAVPGDTVVAAPGTYAGPGNRNLSFDGKAVELRSASGAASCIIDCGGATTGFMFESNETNGTIVDGFTVRNGQHHSGGGMFCCMGSPTIRNCVFEDCSADFAGGGIFVCASSSPRIMTCTVTRNSAAAGGGLHFAMEGITDAALLDCLVLDNEATEDGGGVYLTGPTPEITGCEFRENSAVRNSGAVHSHATDVVITDCRFIENMTGGSGGGVGVTQPTGGAIVPTITRSTFEGNVAAAVGGAIVVRDGNSPPIDSCSFVGNHAGQGGAIYCDVSCNPLITNSVFVGNAADFGSGGGIHNFYASPGIIGCTLVGNTAQINGGGIKNLGGSFPNITNSVVWDNTGDGGAVPAAQVDSEGGAMPVVTHSLVMGGVAGAGNLDTDPLFADALGPDGLPHSGDEDFGPGIGSPLVDAGDSTAVPVGLATDRLEAPRIIDAIFYPNTGIPDAMGRIVDIGAFEAPADLPASCSCELTFDAPPSVDVADLLAYLQLWFALDQAAERNGDEVINVLDLLVFLTCWFDAINGACNA